ncbi:DUF1573 domain-containing protein [Clostridium cochlearium]|jgi:hypothetical protein|uniref:DUF1573 domain-containing protein n=1 Tax=Clostridium cochlearium TaxID=1494 RepID=A0A240B1G8_CLOCO|nr:DUF1573 domain-containing protein [Clostridium cochlearium]MBV1819121.1 hypothetical protein [Bacteroidales bacterium MSK.15.36]NSJ91294.1 DUF1573 domain-containing protein [Coprococcus sp. MSK.21.13]MBE6065113.1 DUF1573 domain-containing protein [Clostridium cochlearium]MBU5269796.1 DUF1573 domain-containing protein [Clostridium cochlearium]MCG4572393.1 DUF1573 domain-containing protein [Clostridium cochlearium]
MKDLIFDSFQSAVDESLLRHKSILDIISKLQESESRINRAVIKSVTSCGCIKINAHKQEIPYEINSINDLTTEFKSHLEGELCPNCKEIIDREIGNNLFYLTSLCNSLNLNLYDIFIKEYNAINILGTYRLR